MSGKHRGHGVSPASFVLLYQEPVTPPAKPMRAGTQTHTNAREETDQDPWGTRTRTDARENDDDDIHATHSVFRDSQNQLSASASFAASMGTETVTKNREQGDTDLSPNFQAIFRGTSVSQERG